MKKFGEVAKLALTGTAKDTLVLFTGNTLSAFLGFVFVWLIARGISIEEFGIYSAAANIVVIISSLSDFGTTSGMVKFASNHESQSQREIANQYVKTAFLIRFFVVFLLSSLLVILSKNITSVLLATTDIKIIFWVSLISLGMFFWNFFQPVLQARRDFLRSVILDLSLGFSRIVFLFILFLSGVSLYKVFLSYSLGTVVSLTAIFFLVGFSFIKTRTNKKIFKQLIKFSGWLGVNNIISSISGRLDVTMLAGFAGATATGLYSIPSRLAMFIPVLASSYSSVLATRLSSFGDKTKEREYILKATKALVPIIVGILFWIVIAKPFIEILFGNKYLPSVGVFRALAASMIPFILTTPSVAAIIYAIKKPIYIGLFSFFQLFVTFFLNLFLIPKFGPYGPTITFSVVFFCLLIYSWLIVIKYYWSNK